MIKNISTQNILKPQIQNIGLKKIVSQINANVSNKQNYDTVELSKKAQALLKENNEIKEKKPTLDYEDSELIHSNRWGAHTKAEFAEWSLTFQRNDLKTLSDEIDYRKAKLEFTMGKISELENFLNGTGSHSDSNMDKTTAKAYLNNYKQSIVDDYANFNVGFNQFSANGLDEMSGGLASEIFKNPLNSLNAETLGLNNLSSDPKEIMEALDNASKIVKGMTVDLESAFAEATDGKGFTEPARSNSAVDGNARFDFFASQMEKNFFIEEISAEDFDLSGETIKIDKTLLANLEEAKSTS